MTLTEGKEENGTYAMQMQLFVCIYMTQRTFRGTRKSWADLVDTTALSKKQGEKEIKERERQFAKKDRR